jgi:hypothetical protein
MESVLERYVIITKCPPKAILYVIFDPLIGNYNYVIEGLWEILGYTRTCVSYLT